MEKIGRPNIFLNSKELQDLMSFYPTLEEVACWFNCSADTIERKIKNEFGFTFAEFRRQYSGKTRLMLKRKAISKALEEDNEKMLMFCLRTLTDLDDRVQDKIETSIENKTLRLVYSLKNI